MKESTSIDEGDRTGRHSTLVTNARVLRKVDVPWNVRIFVWTAGVCQPRASGTTPSCIATNKHLSGGGAREGMRVILSAPALSMDHGGWNTCRLEDPRGGPVLGLSGLTE